MTHHRQLPVGYYDVEKYHFEWQCFLRSYSGNCLATHICFSGLKKICLYTKNQLCHIVNQEPCHLKYIKLLFSHIYTLYNNNTHRKRMGETESEGERECY